MELQRVQPLGISDTDESVELKKFGYGHPLLLIYSVDGEEHRSVLRTVNRNGYGRERCDDRVAAVWLDNETFNRLPRHVSVEDMLAVNANGELSSLSDAVDLALLTTYAPGYPYANDLVRLLGEDRPGSIDRDRTRGLAQYLVGIHKVAHDDPLLWRRRLRDLIGHGEGIMGLTDSYFDSNEATEHPDFPVPRERLQRIEQMANSWRWSLKPLARRLVQVHGDFHPFNIIYRCKQDAEEGDLLDFAVIDRSRGAWGESADDVSCLTINYVSFSLQRSGRMDSPFAELHELFWETYLSLTGDLEMLSVIQPWLAWRALVLASPQWYPTISLQTREALLRFAEHVLEESTYRWEAVNSYLGLD